MLRRIQCSETEMPELVQDKQAKRSAVPHKSASDNVDGFEQQAQSVLIFRSAMGTLTGTALRRCSQITQRTEEWNIGGPPKSRAGR